MHKQNTNHVPQIEVYIKHWIGRLRGTVRSLSQATPFILKALIIWAIKPYCIANRNNNTI